VHSPLFSASAGRSEDLIQTAKLLTEAKADVRETDEEGKTCLHHALDKKRYGMVEFLIKAKGDVNASDARGFTPVAKAAAKNHLESVTLLLDAKANPAVEAESGMSPLGTATRKGNVEMMKKLLASGAKLDAAALYAAITSQDEAPENLLQERGITPLVQSATGRIALYLAAEEDEEEAAKRLLDWHQKENHNPEQYVNMKDSKGITPLMVAASTGSGKVAKSLIDAKADLDLQDEEGNTALHHADNGNQGNAFGHLVDQGADEFIDNNKGHKPQKPGEGGACAIS